MVSLNVAPKNPAQINIRDKEKEVYKDRSRPRTKESNTSKEEKLEGYKEEEESNFEQDIDTNDSDDVSFSYSKFSHISGISFLQGRGHSAGSLMHESPFVRDIKNKVQEVKFHGEPAGSIRNQHSAGRTQSTDNWRNRPNKPIPRTSEGTSFAPLEYGLQDHDLREDSTPEKKEKKHNPQKNPFQRQSLRTKATPLKERSIKEAPYNVSLTPAQRLEKREVQQSESVLDNFQISELVGKGAFASVYKGLNLRTNQLVAIKQITLEQDQDILQLMGEIDLLKILKHPNIVKYHGFVKTDTSLNVFLEFCTGGSLRQLYKQTKHGLSESLIISYVRQILQGLSYLHEQGVVHRDVKAANVLLTEDSSVKLADFGVATKVTSQHQTVVGTPNWMAPETVLGGEGLCTASDIWSLGATIIELLTKNPPYHNLNPMATLHAIGTEDHPPLPKSISSLASSFLLECFQKQPNLRKNAKLLLKHKWITSNQSDPSKHMSHKNNGEELEYKYNLRELNSYSENQEDNWEKDFINTDFSRVTKIASSNNSRNTDNKLSKAELLTMFTEQHEELEFNEVPQETDIKLEDSQILDNRLKNYERAEINASDNLEEEEDDPFANLDVDEIDTKELEIQSRMDHLLKKFCDRVDICHSGNDEVASSLTKISGRMLHLIKKYPSLHGIVIREHGISSMTELLDSAVEFPKHQKLWFNVLLILNHIFEYNNSQFENVCILGGIPVITQFRSVSYDLQVRQQVLKFLTFFEKSDKALSMFISCGGLRVLSKFVEDDFDYTPEFPIVSIHCIHRILTRDLTKSRSNLCRILSKYGVIFWFVALLNRLSKITEDNKPQTISIQTIEDTINKVMSIIQAFGQSEARVRIKVSSSDLIKLFIKVYPNLDFNHQLIILKFFKSISQVSEILQNLYSADILEFLVRVIRTYVPSTPHYKEVLNVVCPTIYNCCYLNHTKETQLVKLGAAPFLKNLSKINLPFRQFVLPILCELVHCGSYVRLVLVKNDILNVYFNLILDPYWHSNALDSVITWAQLEPVDINLHIHKSLNCFISGFMLPKVSNMESSLDNYLKLLLLQKSLKYFMIREPLINNILSKLVFYSNNPVIQLNLLRILKVLVSAGTHSGVLYKMSICSKLKSILSTLKSKQNSILVEELATDIVTMIE